MDLKLIEDLLEAVTKVVQDSGSYKEKAVAIKAACSDEDRNNLSEFLSWFDDDEEV